MGARLAAAERNARVGAAPTRPLAAPVRSVAVGDPQAPLPHFLAVLDAHGLLGDEGWLLPEVRLVSMGDHFDFGGAAEWEAAAADGFAALTWLSAHPPEQVTLLLGNHDSARVGELAGFDDPSFARARAHAARVYLGRKRARDEPEEAAFLAAWPTLPSSELAARDFSAFESRQRGLVARLLRAGRFRLAAHAGPKVLLTHAGVTQRELALLGQVGGDAVQVAAALNDWLDARVAAWGEGPLELAPLHTHGDGLGEGGGLLYHRAALSADVPGPRRRRYPLEELPPHLTQVIGHVRDQKSRAMLGLDSGPAVSGPVRSLRVEGDDFEYRPGVLPRAHLIFLDGGMKDAAPADYQLLALDTLSALAGRR